METLNWHIPSDKNFLRRHFQHSRLHSTVNPTIKTTNNSHFTYTTPRNNRNLSWTKPKAIHTAIKNTTLNELSELDIPGFGRVFRTNFSWIRRFCWILILTILTFISGHQIYSRFLVFFHVEPAVVVRYESRSSFEIPRTTICPNTINFNPKLQIIVNKFFNVSKWDDKYFFKLIEYKSLEEIWNLTEILNNQPETDISENLSLLGDSKRQYVKHNLENIFTPIGKCKRLHSLTNVSYIGFYTFFRIRNPYHGKNILEEYGNNTSTTGIRLYLERSDFNNYSQYLVTLLAMELPLFHKMTTVLRMKELEYISTREYPCVSASKFNECFNNCIDNYIVKSENISCKLPYMSSDIKIRWCKTEEEFRHVYEATSRAIYRVSLRTCSCSRICSQLYFDITTIRIEPLTDNSSVLDLIFNFPDNNVERITEYNSYTGAALLSDIGGSLGLYLGICVVSVLALIEVIVINVVTPVYHHIIR